MDRYIGQIVGVLCSPLAGGAAGFLFQKEECSTIPGGQIGGYSYGSRDLCNSTFNESIGITLTLIGWGIMVVWFLVQVWSEQQAARQPPAG